MNYKIIQANKFKYNRAFAKITDGKTEKSVCINTNGEIVFELPESHMYSSNFDYGAIAKVGTSFGNKFAVINTKGEFLTKFIYSKYKMWFSNTNFGMVQVQKDGLWGYIDIRGQEVIPCLYNNGLSEFSEGTSVVFHDKKPALIDYKNNILIPFGIYQGMGICFKNILPAKKDNKWGLIDRDNNILVDFKFDDIKNSSNDECLLFSAKKGNKWGIINAFGEVIEHFVYDDIIFDSKTYYDTSGYWHIRKGDKFALYSAISGRFLTGFIFDGIGNYSDGLIDVCIDDNYGFIDTNGKEIVPIIYDYVLGKFSEGLVPVSNDSKYGMINRADEIIIPIEYDVLYPSSNGLIVAINLNDEYGVIDSENKTVIPFGKYKTIDNYSCGYAVAEDENGYCYLDKTGKPLKIFENDTNCKVYQLNIR